MKPCTGWHTRPADELAQADADYAADNTVSGEEIRRRYGCGEPDALWPVRLVAVVGLGACLVGRELG